MAELDLISAIAAVYQAATSPGRWTSAMDELGRLFGGHTGAILITTDPERRKTAILSSADRTSSITEYTSNWSRRAPRSVFESGSAARDADATACGFDILQASWSIPEGAVRADHMLMDKDRLEGSDFYNEHLRRFDFHHAFAAKLWENQHGDGVLSVSRAKRQGGFTDDDLSRYLTLQPHLQRALETAQRLAWTEAGARDAERGFEGLACASIILDQAGLCAYVNPAAERLIEGSQALRLINGRLRAANPSVEARLQAAILQALGVHDRPRQGGAVAIPRPTGARALAALIVPVASDHDWFLPRRPRAIVTLADPEVRRTPRRCDLEALYGLTPSEAAVAQGIGQGLEVACIAANLGLTVYTARQYLTRVYAKTQTERQNDLATLLASIAWR